MLKGKIKIKVPFSSLQPSDYLRLNLQLPDFLRLCKRLKQDRYTPNYRRYNRRHLPSILQLSSHELLERIKLSTSLVHSKSARQSYQDARLANILLIPS